MCGVICVVGTKRVRIYEQLWTLVTFGLSLFQSRSLETQCLAAYV